MGGEVKRRQQKATARTAARLIGCGGRAAAAPAAADVVGTHDVEFFFFAVSLVRNNSLPTALLCARIHSRVRGDEEKQTMTASGTTYQLL